MRRFHLWPWALVLLLAGGGCVGRAEGRSSTADSAGGARLMMLLQAEHGAPTAAELEALAPPAELGHLLAAVADDEAAPPLARNRALSALERYPSPEGARLLEQIAASGATPFARQLAARTLEHLRPALPGGSAAKP